MLSTPTSVAVSITSSSVVDAFRTIGATHVVTVPDTNLKTVLADLASAEDIAVVRMSTEDDVLGVCTGLWMAGQRPVALMQQVGLFASVNALRAFTHDHKVPLAIVAGLYGRDVTRAIDDDQPSGVRLCVPLLQTLGIRAAVVEGPAEVPLIAPSLAEAFDARCTSVVLFGAPTE